MATLWKHPNSPYWTACYTNRLGKQVKRSTKLTNRGNALRVALEFEHMEQQAKANEMTTVQLHKVVNDLAEKVTGGSLVTPTVAEYFRDWLETKRNASEGTLVRYRHTVQLFLQHLGQGTKMRIAGVTPNHVEGFLQRRLASGLAPKTVIVDIKTLRGAFNRAEKLGIILKNPTLAIELPEETSSERDLFTHEQVELLLGAAPTEDWRTLIYLGYFTGARLSDCIALAWQNVDPTKKVIRYKQIKTGKDLVVPIHLDLFQRLCWLNEFTQEGPLCPDLAAKGSGGQHGLSEAFKRIVAKAGIDAGIVQGKGVQKFTKLTFHSLRHSFNSTLANAGVSQEIRCKLTGHSSFSMNDRYTKFNIPPLQTAIEKMPALDQGE